MDMIIKNKTNTLVILVVACFTTMTASSQQSKITDAELSKLLDFANKIICLKTETLFQIKLYLKLNEQWMILRHFSQQGFSILVK